MTRQQGSGITCGALAIALALAAPVTAAAAGTRGLLELDGEHVKWGAPAFGVGAEVTYALLHAPRTFANARNCSEMLPMQAVAERSQLDMTDVEREVAAAFAVWSEPTPLVFREVKDAGSADILIGAQGGSRGIAFTNVRDRQAQGGAVEAGIAPLTQATICLDPSERWQIDGDGNLDSYVLRRVLAHEIGHAIGLDHYGRRGGIMGFGYDEEPLGPPAVHLSALDLGAVTYLYGTRSGTGRWPQAPMRIAETEVLVACGNPRALGAAECPMGISRRTGSRSIYPTH